MTTQIHSVPTAVVQCWCDRASRGLVPADGEVPGHECHECSPEHCWHAREARRCQFGTCPLDAEAELPIADDPQRSVLRVCTLHVGPALSWGRVEPVSELMVRWLAPGRSTAA